jgi:hypothetical protein
MIYSRTFGVAEALQSLVPGALWALSGDSVGGLEWMSDDIERPTDLAILQEVDRLQKEYDALEYQRLRAAEYPDFKEYLDGVVKSDQAQIDAYIAACQAVKEKYPKPEVS